MSFLFSCPFAMQGSKCSPAPPFGLYPEDSLETQCHSGLKKGARELTVSPLHPSSLLPNNHLCVFLQEHREGQARRGPRGPSAFIPVEEVSLEVRAVRGSSVPRSKGQGT